MSERKEQLRGEIASARDEVLAVVAAVGPEQLERPSSNAGWTARDTLAHLSSIEARLQAMWQVALEGREWPAEDASVDAYNDRCVAERRSWSAAALVDELKQSGEKTLRFLDDLPDDGLDRTFNHPTRGLVTVETLVQIVPRHLRAHADEIRAATGG